jgi:ABC-type transport system involved in multi-copper enzyme maturation permease subunit
MLKVMMKDLIMNRTALVANLFIMAAFLVFMSSWEEGASAGAYAFFSGIMMAMVPVMIVTREDRFQAMALGCSLPVTREAVVRSRYLLAAGTAVLGVLFAFALAALAPFSQLSAAELFRPEVILQALSVTTISTALLLPFTLRFGAFGLILVLVASQVLGIVALTMVKLTQSSADKRLLDSIIQAVSGLYVRLGPVGFDLLLVVFLAVMLLSSYAIAVWVFKRREF